MVVSLVPVASMRPDSSFSTQPLNFLPKARICSFMGASVTGTFASEVVAFLSAGTYSAVCP